MKAQLFFDNDITQFRNRKAAVLLILPFIIYVVFWLRLLPASIGSVSMVHIAKYLFYIMFVLFFFVAFVLQKLIFKLCGIIFQWLPAVLSTGTGIVLLFLQVNFINNNYIYAGVYLLFCCIIGSDKKYQNPSLIENISVSFLRFFAFCLFYFNAIFALRDSILG